MVYCVSTSEDQLMYDRSLEHGFNAFENCHSWRLETVVQGGVSDGDVACSTSLLSYFVAEDELKKYLIQGEKDGFQSFLAGMHAEDESQDQEPDGEGQDQEPQDEGQDRETEFSNWLKKFCQKKLESSSDQLRKVKKLLKNRIRSGGPGGEKAAEAGRRNVRLVHRSRWHAGPFFIGLCARHCYVGNCLISRNSKKYPHLGARVANYLRLAQNAPTEVWQSNILYFMCCAVCSQKSFLGYLFRNIIFVSGELLSTRIWSGMRAVGDAWGSQALESSNRLIKEARTYEPTKVFDMLYFAQRKRARSRKLACESSINENIRDAQGGQGWQNVFAKPSHNDACLAPRQEVQRPGWETAKVKSMEESEAALYNKENTFYTWTTDQLAKAEQRCPGKSIVYRFDPVARPAAPDEQFLIEKLCVYPQFQLSSQKQTLERLPQAATCKAKFEMLEEEDAAQQRHLMRQVCGGEFSLTKFAIWDRKTCVVEVLKDKSDGSRHYRCSCEFCLGTCPNARPGDKQFLKSTQPKLNKPFATYTSKAVNNKRKNPEEADAQTPKRKKKAGRKKKQQVFDMSSRGRGYSAIEQWTDNEVDYAGGFVEAPDSASTESFLKKVEDRLGFITKNRKVSLKILDLLEGTYGDEQEHASRNKELVLKIRQGTAAAARELEFP